MIEWIKLLDEETGDLTTEFETLLRQVFSHFDQDNDNRWNLKEIQTFAIATNNVEFDENTIAELKESFCDDEGCLTVSGLLGMYHLQTQNDEEETRRDLSRWTFLTPAASPTTRLKE